MEVKLQFYPTIVFGTLISDRLIKGGGLMAGRLTEVQLYFMIDLSFKFQNPLYRKDREITLSSCSK